MMIGTLDLSVDPDLQQHFGLQQQKINNFRMNATWAVFCLLSPRQYFEQAILGS